jgi:GT2 family glycosyltransferase
VPQDTVPQDIGRARHVVTAVVVAHDAARLLPGLIHAVREQTHPVQRVIGVDTGSRDRSGAALTELLGQDAVFGMESDTGYGAAIASALQRPAARAPGGAGGPANGTEWIWLLHDDCEPAPDALEQLLSGAGHSHLAAVLGPKLKDLSDRRVVREAGITTDRAGRRLTGVEPGEIDQGQHDGNRAVLAVSSAGMLIRRDVWHQLGGFDANLPLFRDDIDFCWRAHAAGYEVRVITDAVVYHREFSARQIRKTPATGHPRVLDRRSALYVFAVNLPLWPMLGVLTGCVAGSLVRTAWYLLSKQQSKAAAHLGAVAWLLRHPRLIWRERRRRAADRKHGYAVLRGQLPRGRTLSRVFEAMAGTLSRGPGYEGGGLHHAVDEAGDDLPLPATDSVARRVLTSPGVLVFAGLAVVALVAERSLTGSVLSGSATFGGGALVPAYSGAGSLWHEYLAGYHDTGIGSAASTSPYIAVLAVLATLAGGKPWLATDVLLLGCVPLAGMTAFLAARRLTSLLGARIWLAASYALLPVATGAVAAGRIGTVVAFVLLPLIGIMVARVLTAPPPPASPSRLTARRAAWAAGLLIAVTAAFVPLAWPVAVIAAVAATAAWSWLGARTVINAWIIAVVPAVLLIPWTFHLVTSPSAFFGEAGVVRPGLAASLHAGSLLLLSPGGPGLPPAWVTAGLVLPAFAALFLRRRTALVYAGWGVALAGLVLALVVNRARITPPQGGAAVGAWPGLAIAIAAAGLLLAATPLIETIGRALVGRPGPEPGDAEDNGPSGLGWRFAVSVAGLAAVVSAPALAAGYWLADGLDGPVSAAGTPILPAFVAASSAGPDRTRTLVLRQQGGGPDGGALSYAVLRAADPVPGEPELAETASVRNAVAGVVASLAAAGTGDTGDTGRALSQFDIEYVLMPAPADQALANQLNAAAGLQPLTRSSSYDLWQVSGTVARARVITPAGATVPVRSGAVGVHTVLAPGTSGTLVLAEAAGGWSATLNGRPLAKLAAPVNGWAQGFTLPAGGGRLVITRDDRARNLSLAAEAVALLAVLVLALPGSRSSVPVPAAQAVPLEPRAAGAREQSAAGAREQSAAGAREQSAAGAREQSAAGAPGAPEQDAGGAPEQDAEVLPGATRPASRQRRPQPALASVSAGGRTRAEEGDEVGDGYPAAAEAADDDPFGTQAPARTAEPSLGLTPHLDEGPAPWAGLVPESPESAAPKERPGPASPSSPAPAAPRRGRGQHAARHGKPSRRSRGEG